MKITKIVGSPYQPDCIELTDDNSNTWKASVHIEGCVDFYILYNDEEYLHTCNIDKTIELLQDIKATALRMFGESWSK
jgi:hypothetical protein